MTITLVLLIDRVIMDPRTLRLPDRFEGLRESDASVLQTIITPVEAALRVVDLRFLDMIAANRGAFMILRGDSGAGKSTFLDTIGLFRQDVTTLRVPRGNDVGTALNALQTTATPRVIVLEGREALGRVSRPEMEAAIHEVNQFVRTPEGRRTLVVWPTNTNDLTDLLLEVGRALGAEALLDLEEPVTGFAGPPKLEFTSIAERTVAALNDGVSLSALGLSESEAERLASSSSTIGSYLNHIRRAAISAGAQVEALLVRERYRLWTVVLAGNDAEGDVAALTRGGQSFADIDRLMNSTGANVVKDLKAQPDKIGILGTVLDAKILNLDMVCALAAARTFGSPELHSVMKLAGMQVNPDPQAQERLENSELGILLSGKPLGTRKRGPKAGDNTKDAFAKLIEISRTNDGLLNDAVGRGLVAAGLIESFETEKDLGTVLTFKSDLYCVTGGAPLRVEMMWRGTTGRATIANYVLGKINNYGRAIGLLT